MSSKFVCPEHLKKLHKWISSNCNLIKDWDYEFGKDQDYWTLESVEQFFVICYLYERVNCNQRTALHLLSLGWNDRVPEKYITQAIEIGVVDPETKKMYTWASEHLKLHAKVWIDKDGNNTDDNGNLTE